MKPSKNTISLLTLLIGLTLLFSACKEDNYADWKTLNDSWLEQHKTDPGFIQTSSGLCYKVVHMTNLRNPNPGSDVNITYKGKLIDGTVFDEGTYIKNLSSAIKGWQEGVCKMKDGSSFILYVPASLAYGTTKSGSIIPNSVLIFELTLNESQN